MQAFSRRHNQLKYYYFTWNRLVLYYTKHAQYTLAQYEIQRMLDQAIKDDYKPATGQAYQQLGHIYRLKKLLRPSLEYYRKGVEYLEQSQESYHSMCNAYLNLVSAYIAVNDYDNAQKNLDKARNVVTQPAEGWEIKMREVTINANTGKFAEARALLNEIERSTTAISREHRLIAWYTIYVQSDAYVDALRTLDALFAEYERLGTDKLYYSSFLSSRAQLYAALGNYYAAYKDQQQYLTTYMQQTSADGERTLSEFATLMDVARLDREKTEAQQQVQTERLHRTYVIIVTLAIILALAAFFILTLTRMNRRLALAKRAAEDSDRMKGIFIRTITHEINTPLNAIVGFTELAAGASTDDQERQSYINIVRENSGYLQKLVNDVLYISDIESSDTPPVRTLVELNNCCTQCIAHAEALAPSQVRLLFTPETAAPCMIHTSLPHVTKVLNELLANALRFTQKGTVSLSYAHSADRQQIIFTITDSGPGIPAHEAERIFDRFVKLNAFNQGLGLGLGVCRLIAQALGGEIHLDTTYTQGARFHFTIPTS